MCHFLTRCRPGLCFMVSYAGMCKYKRTRPTPHSNAQAAFRLLCVSHWHLAPSGHPRAAWFTVAQTGVCDAPVPPGPLKPPFTHKKPRTAAHRKSTHAGLLDASSGSPAGHQKEDVPHHGTEVDGVTGADVAITTQTEAQVDERGMKPRGAPVMAESLYFTVDISRLSKLMQLVFGPQLLCPLTVGISHETGLMG